MTDHLATAVAIGVACIAWGALAWYVRWAAGLKRDLFYAERSEKSWRASALNAHRMLAAIHRQRSETTRKGNATKRAEVLAKADELRRDVERVAG